METSLLPKSKEMLNFMFGNGKNPEFKKFNTNIKSSNCQDIYNVSSKTFADLQNSILYADNRIRKELCDKYESQGKGVYWQQKLPSGNNLYPCDISNCYYGNCSMKQTECLSHSLLPYDQSGNIVDTSNNPYLEFRQQPGTVDTQKCYLGNSALRKWCTIPQSRNPAGDDSDKFEYDASSGKCNLTEQYCKAKNKQWDSDSKTCYESGGQQFLKMLFGNTIDAVFSGNCIPSDKRLKTKLNKIAEDYGGKGINLYTFEYLPEAKKYTKKKIELGFLADELETIYPELVVRKDGYKFISYDRETCKDKKYWRIINTINNSSNILKALIYKKVFNTKEQL